MFRTVPHVKTEIYNQGNPLDGGVLKFFAAGTSTPKEVFSDFDRTTSLGSEVTLDSEGRAFIVLGTGNYDVQVHDSDDVQLYKVEDITWDTSAGETAVLTSDTDVSGNAWVLDEDAFTSDSNTKVPTQQSVKAYIDDNFTQNLRGALHGGTLANNGSDADHDLNIGALQATFTDGSEYSQFSLSSTLTKQIDANWAAGDNAGGFPSGLTLSADTTYHVFAIAKDDGTVDAGFDTSLTATNLLSDASGYAWYRRLGSLYTDGSSNWVSFSQDGDEFLIDPVGDYNASNPGTSAVLRALSVPTGIQVYAIHSVRIHDLSPSTVTRGLVTSPDQSDVTPSDDIFTVSLTQTSGNAFDASLVLVRTNTSGQIRTRITQSTADHVIAGATHGWIDTRGRLA